MRRIRRLNLPNRSVTYLAKKQAHVNAGRDVQKTWKSARGSKAMAVVATTLETMAGRRARCMFCQDSRGTDIDHFWPKATYKERAFLWDNMLLTCAGCNRQKGNQFPLDGARQPLLIDPTKDDPWKHLFYDQHTGCITAKIAPGTGQPDPKGVITTDPKMLPLNIDPVTEGRQRTGRNLRRAVAEFLRNRNGRSADSHGVGTQELVEVVSDNSDYGLASWYFENEGANEEPFATLRTRHPKVWDNVRWGIAAGL